MFQRASGPLSSPHADGLNSKPLPCNQLRFDFLLASDVTLPLPQHVMRMLLTRLDKQFDRLMAEEENSDGCFTRAYIKAAFSEGAAERRIWGALLSLMASKDQIGRVWDNWLSERLKRHSKTDSRIELRVVRLAADGVWLERIMNAKSKNLKAVEEYLIEMTRIL